MASKIEPHVSTKGVVTYRVSWRNQGVRQTKAVGNRADAARLKGAVEARGHRVNAKDDDVVSGAIYGKNAPQAVAALAPTWPEVAAEYQAQTSGQRPSTLALYERSLRLHLNRWDHLRIDQITPADVRAFVRAGDGMVKNGRGHGHLKVAQSVFRYAVKAGYRADNPATGVKFASEAAPRHLFWTVAEVELMETAMADPEVVSAQVATMIRLMLWTGARIGEACALRRGDLTDVDSARPRLTIARTATRRAGRAVVGPTKGGRPRTITVGPAAVAALVAQLATVGSADDAWIFPRERDTSEPIAEEVVRAGFVKVQDAAVALGMDDSRRGRLHDLRHTHASRLNQRGRSLIYISRRLGHSSVVETERAYMSFGMDDDAAEMIALD